MEECDSYITNIYVGKGVVFKDTPHFNFKIGLPIIKKEKKKMLDVTITNEQKVMISANPVTGAGNPVELDGPVAVEVQSGEGTFEMVDDKSFYLVSGDNPGDTVYVITADADLGEGVVNISDVINLHIEGAMAQSFGLVAETPELK